MHSIGSISSAATVALALFHTGASALALPPVNSTLTEAEALKIFSRAAAPLPPNSQSCKATNWYDTFNPSCALGNVYEITVGIDYAAGKGCAYIQNHLNAPLKTYDDRGGIWEYSCTAAPGLQTFLRFSTCINQADTINAVLHQIYPTVNGFNCPDD